ncbi:MAG TPA: phytanoyl-CoA dioxygenase [Sneathiellales bacterium]|nr:phytanoyl-CoA dioxygenase [Sneathiellales bacterium]
MSTYRRQGCPNLLFPSMIGRQMPAGEEIMAKVLTGDAIEALRRDGFHFPIHGVSEVDAADYRLQLETFENENGGALKGSHRFKSHLLFKWLADLVRAPHILDAVEDLIGPNIMCWNTHWFIKEANSASFVSWHQDNNYWGLDTEDLVSVWVALSPATIESGCMRMLPGSHLNPILPHVDTNAEHNMLTRGQTIDVDIDENLAVDVELKTGDAALFAYQIAHASYPNQSDDRRIAVALRYIPPTAKQMLADWDSAALVRGEDTHGNFEHEPLPTCDLDPVAVAFHTRAEEQQRQILYKDTEWADARVSTSGARAPY